MTRPLSRRAPSTLAAAAMAACAGHAAAQVIAAVPAGAATAVPVDNPLALLATAAVALAAGLWAVRARARPALLRGLALAAAGGVLAASASYQPRAWAQLAASIFDNPAGQSLLVPVTPIPPANTPGMSYGNGQFGYLPPVAFVPPVFTNQSGVPLRITQITQPPTLATCYANGAVPRQLTDQPPPPGATACTVGAVLGQGAACAVNVNTLCTLAAEMTALTVLGHPTGVTLQSPLPTPVTINNPGPTQVTGISIPPLGTYSFMVVGQCDSVPAHGSCTLMLIPGPAAHGPEMLTIGAGSAYAVQFPVTTAAP